jgi:arylsulfatase A-like enzyme
MLRLNGYSTGAFGKWHETAAWEASVSGPFDRWPTHQGFDKFYGFIGGDTDQWYPLVYDGVTKVTPPKMENTLIFYIAGDNGTSAEVGFVGMYNEMTYFNNVTEKVEDLVPLIDKWGGPETFPHMAAGWAVAFDASFTWTKQVASDFGGTRNGMVVHWPDGIKETGEMRSQFGHVIDIAPTILEAIGLPEPESVNGTPQTPMEGTSLLYTFNDADAEERHTTQYFEMFGNRAVYHDGWFARTIHRAPWQAVNMPPMETELWDLYNVQEDFSLVNNLADKYPKKVVEMEALFMSEAQKYHALPIDDRVIARMV